MSTNLVNTPPIHGNYHGYSSKRPSIKDPRLALLPPNFFTDARVLDIGCNEGWVTCEIAQSWSARKVVGVDIDDTLVRAAWRRRRAVWSLQGPSDEKLSINSYDGQTEVSSPQKRKRHSLESTTGTASRTGQPNYFPISCEHEFGSLPVPPSKTRGQHVFPHNILYRTADWTCTEIPEDAERYDVVIAFSITKWIQLNGGDEALKTFFRRVYDVLEPGGTFILEPQAWDTYAKAKRMHEKLKDNARNLQIGPDDFENILTGIGFGPARHLGTTGEGGFRRPVDLYDRCLSAEPITSH